MTFRHWIVAGLTMTGFGCAGQPKYPQPDISRPHATIAFVAPITPRSGSLREELRLAGDRQCSTHRVMSAYSSRDRGAERARPRTARVSAGATLYFSPFVEELYAAGAIRCASMVSFEPVAGHTYRLRHRHEFIPQEFRRVEVRCSAEVTDDLTGRPPPDLVEYPVTQASRCVGG